MRTLESMTPEKQKKIASETVYIYAPLAHRLGLYNIKSELEDLSLKFNNPEVYFSIGNLKYNSNTRVLPNQGIKIEQILYLLKIL